jgi:DNA-binding MarR family transcriptional regulator
MDFIQQLGEIALASRLRRLSDRLMNDVSRIYLEEGLPFEARWFPVFFLLGQGSSLTTREISRTLRLTHPVVLRIATAMTKQGLTTLSPDPEDADCSRLALTPEGRETVRRMEPIWMEISVATEEMVDRAGQDLLGILERMEGNLERAPLYARLRTRLDRRASAGERP